MKPTERIRSRAGLIVVSCMIFVSAGMTGYFSRYDSTPTVYHHEDGHFSLDRKNGLEVTPQVMFDHMRRYRLFGRIRLIANPQTRLDDWIPIVQQTAKAGAASYQLEVGDEIFRFHVPICMIESENNLSPEIIRLGNPILPTFEGLPKYDVFVVTEVSATCAEATREGRRHVQAGKSVAILTDSTTCRTLLLHSKSLDNDSKGRFVRRSPDFWEKLIQPCIDKLRDLL
jgi:hypothetical protein